MKFYGMGIKVKIRLMTLLIFPVYMIESEFQLTGFLMCHFFAHFVHISAQPYILTPFSRKFCVLMKKMKNVIRFAIVKISILTIFMQN